MPRRSLPHRLGIIALLTCLALASSALAEELPRGLRVWRVGDLAYLATFDGHLQTWDLRDPQAPQLRSDRDVGGPVLDLHVDGTQVTAIVVAPRPVVFTLDQDGRLTGEPVVGLALGHTPTVARGLHVIGQVVEVRGAALLLKLEAPRSVRAGQSLRVRSKRKATQVDPFSGDDYETMDDADIVVEVTRIEGDRAIAELGRGQTAEPGDTVERTSRVAPTVTWLPDRLPHDIWAKVLIRPMLNFGRSGSGMLAELGVGKNLGNWQLALQARPLPLSTEGLGPTHVYGTVAYQWDYLELGLGAGAFHHQSRCWSWFESGECEPASWRLSAVQQVRLGPADGVHFKLTVSEFDETSDGEPAVVDAGLVLPVARYVDLLMQGGGGDDVGWFEVGARMFLQGAGGADTLLLTVAAGGSYFRALGIGRTQLGGPHLTVGIETRM